MNEINHVKTKDNQRTWVKPTLIKLSSGTGGIEVTPTKKATHSQETGQGSSKSIS